MDGSDEARSESGDRRTAAGIVREEARHVLDGQLQLLRETDRKAMATARVVAVILGLLLSALSLVETPSRAVNGWLTFGSVLLLASLAVAVLTYSVDRPTYGIGTGYLDDVGDDLGNPRHVERDLLPRYAHWIEANAEEVGSNSTYLLVSQWLLVAGLAILAVGVSQFV